MTTFNANEYKLTATPEEIKSRLPAFIEKYGDSHVETAKKLLEASTAWQRSLYLGGAEFILYRGSVFIDKHQGLSEMFFSLDAVTQEYLINWIHHDNWISLYRAVKAIKLSDSSITTKTPNFEIGRLVEEQKIYFDSDFSRLLSIDFRAAPLFWVSVVFLVKHYGHEATYSMFSTLTELKVNLDEIDFVDLAADWDTASDNQELLAWVTEMYPLPNPVETSGTVSGRYK